jgi:transcription initiation factor TFIIB
MVNPYPHKLDFLDDEEEDNCCDEPDYTININGERVCRKCGTTFGQQFVSNEKRAYTAEEVRSRRRTEPRWRSFGPRTIIGISSTDGKGRQLASRKQAMFNRLSKIQGSLINSIERNFWEARPKISALARKLAIPDYIVETAWKIYSEVARQKLTMGRSIEGFVTAAIYAAIRIHDFPRLLEEITEIAMIPLRAVHRSLGLIVRNVLPVLNFKYKPIGPEPLIFRFGNDLDLSISIQQKASRMLAVASYHGLKKMGKDPKGLAAAALYMAAKKTPERKTQTEVAEIARITEVTLRTRAKQIREHLQKRTSPGRR